MGPRGGEGFTVGNFSTLPQLPGSSMGPALGAMPLADGSPAYFAVLNESRLDYDLNKDGLKTAEFYGLGNRFGLQRSTKPDINADRPMTLNLCSFPS